MAAVIEQSPSTIIDHHDRLQPTAAASATVTKASAEGGPGGGGFTSRFGWCYFCVVVAEFDAGGDPGVEQSTTIHSTPLAIIPPSWTPTADVEAAAAVEATAVVAAADTPAATAAASHPAGRPASRPASQSPS